MKHLIGLLLCRLGRHHWLDVPRPGYDGFVCICNRCWLRRA